MSTTRFRWLSERRAFLYDLWPLMLSELAPDAGQRPERPLFDALLRAEGSIATVLEEQPEVLFGEGEERRRLFA